MLEVDSASRLAEVLATAVAREIPWFVIGKGSNVLIADSGWPGLVIQLAGELKLFDIEAGRVDAGGGVTLSRLAAAAAEAGLTGLEPLALIPGTVGGAVAMNAGAYGSAIAHVVESVELCLPGELRQVPRDELSFSYRRCLLPADAIVSRVVLRLVTADPEGVRAAMNDFKSRRRRTQPAGGRTCGSVFRNPPDSSAGELLERAGCKGMRAGDAEISIVHANFIENKGAARAADVLKLMNECRRRVHESFGVILEPEVRLLGDIELEHLS